jgi:hypothetical protein
VDAADAFAATADETLDPLAPLVCWPDYAIR